LPSINTGGSAPPADTTKANPADENTQEQQASTDAANYKVVSVFFSTDRNLSGKKVAAEMFGVKRSDMRYGMCEVSIPLHHEIGELESPSILRFELRENPEKHVVLLSAKIEDKDLFFNHLSAAIQESGKKSALLFVHGYNVSFETAARRTAQISADLQFDGAAVFYSWPSQGNLAGYTVDESNIEWTQANLKSFLDDFFTRSPAENIYLIAHSMGNRALTRAVADLIREKPEFKPRLKEIILAAPDIDAEVFRRDIAPALAATGAPVTLYASSKDEALLASKKIHAYLRAGDSGLGLVITKGVETIDATEVDTSFVGHSYFADNRAAIADIYYLIRDGLPADQRFGLSSVNIASGRYWTFKN
ncbi:MAG TPA: alpha/beta fold hydrolase, partial [Spongiibacteraceae bacterium]|nr:alpha/beta fold hydrolase [Spongiibacteraceae bacterium]